MASFGKNLSAQLTLRESHWRHTNGRSHYGGDAWGRVRCLQPVGSAGEHGHTTIVIQYTEPVTIVKAAFFANRRKSTMLVNCIFLS